MQKISEKMSRAQHMQLINQLVDKGLVKVMSRKAFQVYLTLIRYYNWQRRICFPSYKTIREKTGLSFRHIRSALEELKSYNLISIGKEKVYKGKRNVYYLAEELSIPTQKYKKRKNGKKLFLEEKGKVKDKISDFPRRKSLESSLFMDAVDLDEGDLLPTDEISSLPTGENSSLPTGEVEQKNITIKSITAIENITAIKDIITGASSKNYTLRSYIKKNSFEEIAREKDEAARKYVSLAETANVLEEITSSPLFNNLKLPPLTTIEKMFVLACVCIADCRGRLRAHHGYLLSCMWWIFPPETTPEDMKTIRDRVCKKIGIKFCKMKKESFSGVSEVEYMKFVNWQKYLPIRRYIKNKENLFPFWQR